MTTIAARRSPRWWLALAAAFVGASLWVGSAHARACASDADCPRGFGCLGGRTSDAIPPFPSTSRAADGGLAGVCTSLECHSDADCGDGTRCELDVSTLCTQRPDGTMSCGPGNMCVPAWQARCKADGDCGAGFTCSGTDGYDELAPPSEAKVPSYAMATSVPCASILPPVVPPNVNLNPTDASTCTAIVWSTCIAQPTGPCTVDTDCPATWNCACPMEGPVGGGLAGAGELPADASGAAADAACTPQCLPPNSDLAPIYPSSGGGFGGNAPLGPTPAGSQTPAPAVRGADAGAARGTSTSAASPGAASSQGGCQVIAGDPRTCAPWATLAGLLLALGGRRARTRISK
jgi:hypothetical protein